MVIVGAGCGREIMVGRVIEESRVVFNDGDWDSVMSYLFPSVVGDGCGMVWDACAEPCWKGLVL